MKPILKWAGGKRQLLPEIRKRLPKEFCTYYEPFIGGGAALFDLQPKRFVLGDVNQELINLYSVVQSDLQALVTKLKQYKNDKDFFYELRGLDRIEQYEALSNVERAARTLYLNKTCFNGLYRVNKAGQFNTPFGKYKNPNIVNELGLTAVSKFLNSSDCRLLHGDYKAVLASAGAGDFAYLDPPYDPVSPTASFTGYTKGGFGRTQQQELKQTCDELIARGVKFLLSNSATDFILDLYGDYNIGVVGANRAINSKGSERGKVSEVLISNY